MKVIKNKIFLLFMVTFVSMFIIPLLVVNILKEDAVLGILILLLMCVYPIISFIIGIVVGKDICKLWYIPLINFILFPILYWIVMKDIVWDFYIYSFGYLGISIISIIITYLINKKVKKN